VVNGDILMAFATEYHRFVWFCVEIWQLVCLLAWFHQFAMAENSIVESEFKEMSCSTPVTPFKPGNPYTPESDSSCQSHSANPFAPENKLIIQLIFLHTTRSL